MSKTLRIGASKSPLLNLVPKISLQGFLSEIQPEFSEEQIQHIGQIAFATYRHLNGSPKQREQTREGQVLEKQWYKSLDNGNPDFTVYDGPYYVGELWACWMKYSRPYLQAIEKPNSLPTNRILMDDLGTVKTIADLGCGLGYTTAALTQLFPTANVWATNLGNTVQMRIATKYAAQYGFGMRETVAEIAQPMDLIFASEYFEHIPNPVTHLREILDILHPRNMLIANTFTADAIGHFRSYEVDGQRLSGKKTSLLFKKELRQRGYQKMETNLWNNRPAYWKHIDWRYGA